MPSVFNKIKHTKVVVNMTNCVVSDTTVNVVGGDKNTYGERRTHEMEFDRGRSSSRSFVDKGKDLLKFRTRKVTVFMGENDLQEIQADFGRGVVKTCVAYDTTKFEHPPPPCGEPRVIDGKKYKRILLQVFFPSGVRSQIKMKRSGDHHVHFFVNKMQKVLVNYHGMEGKIPREVDCATRFRNDHLKIEMKGKLLVSKLFDESYEEDKRFFSSGFTVQDRDTLCANLPPAVALFM